MAQDRYLTLQTTPAGMNMIIRTLYGDSITFKRIEVGNGRPQDLDNVTDLENPLLEIQLSEMEDHDDYLVLTGTTTSSEVAASFYGNELGVIAEDDDGVEHLYAYRYSETDVDFFPASNSGRTLELTLSVVVQLGNAENVTAILIEGDTYAKKKDFEDHLAADDNPHQVTKSQVGLGNVPNVSTNDQTPTYTMAGALANLVSGETLTAAMAKIAKAVSSLISHLSANNPHSITPDKIGAAATSHTHSAADINSGTLGVARGGTGATTIAQAAKALLGNGVSEIKGIIQFADSGNSSNIFRGIMGTMAENDMFRVGCYGTAKDAGVLEIATEDNGDEIHLHRQYGHATQQGAGYGATWQYVVHQAYILNAAGNTVLSGSCSATSHITTSDRKIKENIADIDAAKALAIISGVRPVSFNLKDDEKKRGKMGFIAQEVYDLMQELGYRSSAIYQADMLPKDVEDVNYETVLSDEEIRRHDDAEMSWTIDYQQLIAPMIKVIQEQERRISELEALVSRTGTEES